MARPIVPPICLPRIDLPTSAAICPATRLTTERVTSRAMTWLVDRRLLRGRLVPKMLPNAAPMALNTAPKPPVAEASAVVPAGALVEPEVLGVGDVERAQVGLLAVLRIARVAVGAVPPGVDDPEDEER